MEKRALLALIGLATAIGCGDDSGGGVTAGTAATPTAGGMAVGVAGTMSAAGGGGSPTAGSSAGRGAAGTAAGTGAAGRAAPGTGAAGMPAAGATAAGTGATAGTGAAGMAAGGAGGMMMTAGTGAGGAAAGTGGAAGGMATGEFKLTSPAVMDGGMLPQANRCVMLSGDTGPSPALMWTAGPAGTMSYALTFTDKGNGYAHWTIYDIPSSVTMLPMGVPEGASPAMPAGAKQSANQNAFVGGPGYFGPCAGMGNYEFKVWAISKAMLGATGMDAATVRAAIEMNDLASATLGIVSAPPNATAP